MEAIKLIGILMLINTAIIALIYLNNPDISKWKIITFSSVGIVVGVILLFSDRISSIDIADFAKIEMNRKKAEENLGVIESIRADVENQKNKIDAVFRDLNETNKKASAALETADKIQGKSEEIEKIQDEAKVKVNSMNSLLEFQLVALKAQNDDRKSFDILIKHSRNVDDPMRDVSSSILLTIMSDPVVENTMFSTINWEYLKIDPATATIQEMLNVLSRIPSRMSVDLFTHIWNRENIPLNDKVHLAIQLINESKSVVMLNSACIYLNKITGINKNALIWEVYLNWWKENESKYQ